MLDFTKIPLHELIAFAANKARGNMGEGRPHVHFQEMLEAAARFSVAHYEGDAEGMYLAAEQVMLAGDSVHVETPEPVNVEPDWQAEESRAHEKAAL